MLYLRIREVLGDAIDAMWVDFFPQRTQAINATKQRHGEMWSERWRGAKIPSKKRMVPKFFSWLRPLEDACMAFFIHQTPKRICIFATVETWCESPPVELEEWKECCKQLSERCRRCAVRHTSQIHGLAGPIHWWRYMNTSGGSYTYRPFQCGGKRKHDLQKCLFLWGGYVSSLEGNVIWEWCTNLPTHQFFAGGLVIC